MTVTRKGSSRKSLEPYSASGQGKVNLSCEKELLVLVLMIIMLDLEHCKHVVTKILDRNTLSMLFFLVSFPGWLQ